VKIIRSNEVIFVDMGPFGEIFFCFLTLLLKGFAHLAIRVFIGQKMSVAFVEGSLDFSKVDSSDFPCICRM
jgi:hypothetical protein